MQSEKLVNLLLKLVSLASYRGYEKGTIEIANYIADFLASHGVAVEVHDLGSNQANVIAGVGEGKKSVLLVGHLDTVEVEGMTVPAFGALSGEKVYGRGTVDMKGGVAAMIVALLELLQDRDLDKQIIFLGDACEEQGNLGAIKFLESAHPKYDYVIIGEPTNLKPAIAHKGVLWAKVTFKGRTAHASFPQHGINAINGAAEFIKLINEKLLPLFEERRDPFLGVPTLNVGVIHGGTGPNVVPAMCYLQIDRRYLPKEKPEDILIELSQLADQAARKTATAFELDELPQTRNPQHIPFWVSPDEELVKIVRVVLRKMGLDDQLVSVPFWTEAPLFSKGGSVPTIIIGPGDPSLAHAPNEHIEVKDLLKAAEIYRGICKTL